MIYNAVPLLTSKDKISGSGQKIAVAARSNISEYDVRDFRALFQPFARPNVLQIIVNGADPGLTYDEDMVEATADVEYAGALAPDADIVLIVSASTNDSDGIALSALYAVDNNLAPVLSVSYGLCESALGTAGNEFYAALWQQAAAQGITVVVSSGDSGPASCDLPFASGDAGTPVAASKGAAVNGLASTPYNVAVGGTQFSDNATEAYWASELDVAFGSALSYIPEVAWNESCSPYSCGASKSNIAASGGGPSRCTAASVDADGSLRCAGHYPKPAWQTGPGVPSDGARDLPDISLSSAAHDGYVLCFGGSCSVDQASGIFNFYIVGGTSLSAPAFGSVMALVNQKTASRQGQAAPVLYGLGASESARGLRCDTSWPAFGFESCAIRDVTEGNSNVPCAGGSPGCSETGTGIYGTLFGSSATPGYDMVTGLGSIDVTNLVTNWSIQSRAATQVLLAVSPLTFRHGDQVELAVTVTPESGQGVPSGDVVILTDSASPNSGAVSRYSLTNGSLIEKLASLPGGTYEISAQYAGDSDFAPGASNSVTVTVQPEGSRTELSVSLDSAGKLSPIGATVPFGSRIVLNARAAGVSGMGVPTGVVSISGRVPLPGASITQVMPLNNIGAVEASAVLSSIGEYNFSAAYSGDAGFQPSTGQQVALSVVKANTALTANANVTRVSRSSTVQVHVRVSTTSVLPISPSGTARAIVGDIQLQSAKVHKCAEPSDFACAEVELNLPAWKLAVGVNTLGVIYEGDEYYGASSASPLAINVDAAGTLPGAALTVNLSVNTPMVAVGDIVSLKAVVAHDSQPVGGGTVTFYSGVRALGTVQVVGIHPAPGFTCGTATLKTRLPAGANSVTAHYNGQGRTYQAAVSRTVNVTVNGNVPTRSQLTAAENAHNLSDYDLSVSVLGSSATGPSGRVAFYNNTENATLGQAELEVPELPFALVGTQGIATDDQPIADGVAVASADLNGDGTPDAVTANNADNSISVLLGKGDGTFEPARQFSLDSGATQIIVLDTNQDGIPDIVATTMLGAVDVLLGNGDGTFGAGKSVVVADPPLGVVEGDFNGDGIPDLAAYSAITPTMYASPCVFVLLGNGDGTFALAQTYVSGEIVTGLAVDDFNHDGAPDLITSGATGLYLLAGQGNGTFHLDDVRPYDGGGDYFLSQVSGPVTGDFNGDGIADVATIPDMVRYEVLVVSGNADGGFEKAEALSPAGFSYFDTIIDQARLNIADVNADGIPDVVQMLVGTSGGKTIAGLYVYFGNGDGTFSQAKALTVPMWNRNPPNSFVLADLNGDGLDDVLATTRLDSSVGLTAAILQSVRTATLTTSLGNSAQTVQASYTPSTESNFGPSKSNPLTLGRLIPTTSTLQYGYKNAQGNCYLGGASASLYWDSVPCFYLHVVPSQSGATSITGTVTLNGTSPSGGAITAGPYTVYPDGSGGGYIYIFYSYGLGDAGQYKFSMSYGGDSNFQRSSSAGEITATVQPLPTSTTLTGPAILAAGNTAVFTAQVVSPIFSNLYLPGALSIYDGDTLLQKNYAGSNTTSFALTSLTAGTHYITARYEGLMGQYNSMNAAPSISGPFAITVHDRNQQPPAKVVLTVTPQTPDAGEPVNLLATVTDAGGIPETKGTVTFFDGNTRMATVPLGGANAGIAIFRCTLSVTKHQIAARYNGFAYLTGSGAQTQVAVTSDVKTIAVGSVAMSETILTEKINEQSKQAYDLSGQVIGYGMLPPDGNIVFQDVTSSVTLGSVAVDATQAHPGFGESKTIEIIGKADDVSAADFNGDGFTDFVVLDATNKTLHLLIAKGDGTYLPQTDYSLPATPTAFGSADVNRDGTPDIVIGSTNKQLSVFLGNPKGSFQGLKSSTISFVPGRFLVGDLNGDGLDDIVVTGQAGTSNLAVLPGNGDGTFRASTNYVIPKLSGGAPCILEDLNGDGVLDLLLVTDSYASYVMFGIGDGKLQAPLYLNETNGNTISSDLNGDSIPDLAVITAAGNVGVQLGRGDGTFTPTRYYSSGPLQLNNREDGSDPSSAFLPIDVADFNGDGVPDLITPGMVLLGKGDGTFRQNEIAFKGSYSILADANNDGFPDLVSTNDGALSVQYGGTTASAVLPNTRVRGNGIHDVRAMFTPANGNPYEPSLSNSALLQAYETALTELSLKQTYPVTGKASYGQSVTIAATVAGTGVGTPTGTVVFAIDKIPQQQSALSSAGTSELIAEHLSGGAHTILANYSGDSSFAPSSSVLAITVDRAASNVLLSSSTDDANLGSTVTLLANVRGQGGTARPSGTIEFLDDDTRLGSAQLDGSGLARYSTSALGAGTHKITAFYSGDGNFAPDTSPVYSQTVTAPDFQLAVSPASLTVAPGAPALATITATAIGGYSGSLDLACTNISSDVTCSFEPSGLSLGGSQTTQSSRLTVTIRAQKLVSLRDDEVGTGTTAFLAALFAGVPGLFLVSFISGQRKQKRQTTIGVAVLLSLVLTSIFLTLTACGGRSSSVEPAQRSISYKVPVTVSGTVTHNLDLTILLR